MDNIREELKHFVENNTSEIICRNWENDLRKKNLYEDLLEMFVRLAESVKDGSVYSAGYAEYLLSVVEQDLKRLEEDV